MRTGIAYSPRTASAIQKADALPQGRPNGFPERVAINTGGSGSAIYWAKITGVTDVNNYTVDIYNRSDETTPLETGKQCRVFDIVDSLAVGDWFPVQKSNITGEDYESIQQLGDL